jgi:hypothetical protein
MASRIGAAGTVDIGFVLQKQDHVGGSDLVRSKWTVEVFEEHQEATPAPTGITMRIIMPITRHTSPPRSMTTHIRAEVDAFVGMDDDGAVLFAAMRHGTGASRKVAPWSIDYRYSTVPRAISLTNFPQSEAVCASPLQAPVPATRK